MRSVIALAVLNAFIIGFVVGTHTMATKLQVNNVPIQQPAKKEVKRVWA